MREVADDESMLPTPGRQDEEATQVDEAPPPQMVKADQAESLQPQGYGGHQQPCRSHHAPGRRDEAVRLPAQAVLKSGRGTATRADVSTLTHELQRNIRHMNTLSSSIKELVLALGLHSNQVKVNSQNLAGLITAMTVYTESNMALTQTLHSVAASVSTSLAPTIPRPSVPPQMIVPPKRPHGGRRRRRQNVPPFDQRERPGPLAPRDDHQYRL